MDMRKKNETKKKIQIKLNKMRQNFGKMKFSKIKFLWIKMIDISDKLSCIAYKCKDIVYKLYSIYE